MNHLNDEQMAEWMAGDGSDELGRHLASCEQCRNEAYALRDQVSRYAIAMRRQAAEAQTSARKMNLHPGRVLTLHRAAWAGGAVLSLALLAQTAWILRPHAPEAQPTTAKIEQVSPTASAPSAPASAMSANSGSSGSTSTHSASMSDDELLEAVNNDLSREVPQALAPVSAITRERNEIATASLRAEELDALHSKEK